MSNRINRRSVMGSQRARQSIIITSDDAYSFALRTAYLAYLLHPRPRLKVAAPAPPVRTLTTTSFHELIQDFSLRDRDPKSTRLPKDFLPLLQKRLEGVWMGKDTHVEFKDAAVKRTFAAFYTAFKEPRFYEGVAKSRRAEDLVLIFYSSATKELQKLKQDDSWKWLVDRHVALFVRLMQTTLKEKDWAGNHPELVSRFATLESKLLQHDENLTDDSSSSATASTISTAPAPLSYNVNDMPLVKLVSRIYSVPLSTCQQDIDRNRAVWTERAALQDMKAYTNHLNLNNKMTLRSEDFDTEEAFEAWRKAETPVLSQMMLAIVQSNPTELAKTTSNSVTSSHHRYNSSISYSMSADMLRSPVSSTPISEHASFKFDQPVDMESLNLNSGSADDAAEKPYTYIPAEPRVFLRHIVEKCLSYDLQDPELQPAEIPGVDGPVRLLSKSSVELLNEICARWRVPLFSRLVIFLDVIRSKYQEAQIDLTTLDIAFIYVKASLEVDWTHWTIADQNLYRQVLSVVHDSLLRELYDILQHAFDAKKVPTGEVQWILDKHIYEDPLFTVSDMDSYIEQLKEGLRSKAQEIADEIIRDLPEEKDQLDPLHVIELTQKVLKLAEKIQKRFPQPIMSHVDPLNIYVEVVFPKFVLGMTNAIQEIIEAYAARGEEVPIEDGFELYQELSEIRRAYCEAFPEQKFPVRLEDYLSEFVTRWIKITDSKVIGWVDNAIKEDSFVITVREEQGREPTDEERHTVSVVDIFRSFNQTVETLTKLEWKDDLQYARFMTSLSKTLGSGIARYCEVVEKLFAHEMDRQTPEQEAAANQTRQQKWLAMARDAWSNKDKIEPFQFAPESCIKLNNVEFAIQQFDKLEHNINVDGIAAVLAQYAPPSTRKKMNNYVFTIKIVEAEDLKAMDMNGFSDPYVVLGDEYQKRLAKTRVIYSNLNPRWEETVDITTQGPVWLTATVWDWDTVGDHDCVGRTSIKLDPAHFGDFLPKEFWLDLDTQGRLLLRVSMEGEKDDIQFFFGKAFRTLKRTERDMIRQITDKLSAYIHHCLSPSALKNVMSKGYNSISAVSSLFSRARPASGAAQGITQDDIASAIVPLTTYFNENFAILNQTLTSSVMTLVMTKLWKDVLVTLENLLVPTLSDKPSQQRPLTQQELEIVHKWLQLMFDFFHAVDESTGEATGVPIDVLKSPKYHELQSLSYFYFDSTDNLIRTSERMASAAAARQQQARQNMKASSSSITSSGFLGVPGAKRSKSIYMSRNLGTMRKAKEEKRKEAQAEPNDDMILRILRMRPEAAGYLKDRARQKERLATAAAADAIIRQSMNSNSNRMSKMLSGGAGPSWR
ncbi:hypothetical protein RUND412_001393 [Rhizina undulata]